jgi:hypothetical protein
MKTLKFAPELCELIQTGKKTSTWRLFDDKNLRVGDTLRFLDTKTLLTFGTAVITDITVRTLGTIREEDWLGHERFESVEAMYEVYRSYYGKSVNQTTEVKLVQFLFTTNTHRQEASHNI